MNLDDIPRIPKDHLRAVETLVKDMKPGERTVLLRSISVCVDEDLRAWVDGDSTGLKGAALAGLSVQVERTEAGFILWLDKEDTFEPRKLLASNRWLPVVEFREAFQPSQTQNGR